MALETVTVGRSSTFEKLVDMKMYGTNIGCVLLNSSDFVTNKL